MSTSNFDRIGVPVSLIEDGIDLRTLPGVTYGSPDGLNGPYFTYAGPNGETLWYTTDPRGRSQTINPMFAAGSAMTARIDHVHPGDAPFSFGEAEIDVSILDQGEVATRAQVLMVNMPSELATYRKTFLGRRRLETAPFDTMTGRTVSLRLAVFAGEVNIWPDEAAYEAAQEADHPLGCPSFIPAGMFADAEGRTSPVGFGAGLTKHAGTAPSAYGGSDWHWAVVEAIGGDLGIVWTPDACDAATPDALLSYAGMLIGQWEGLLDLDS